jgi:hypothetical protein
MKVGLLLLFMVAFIAPSGIGQERDANYQDLMKATSAAVASLNTNLEAKAGDAAAADAKKLGEIFGEVRAFWEQRNAADAIEFAANAQAGFGQVGELAAAGQFEEATTALASARSNCGGCHNAHRERGADGEWVIK